jgi:hypothetical protein
MSEFSEFISGGQSEALGEFGETVTFRGVPYTANVGQLGYNPEHGVGGETPRKSCTICMPFPALAFTIHPKADEKIATTSHGVLEIVSCTTDSSGYILTCAEVFQK